MVAIEVMVIAVVAMLVLSCYCIGGNKGGEI